MKILLSLAFIFASAFCSFGQSPPLVVKPAPPNESAGDERKIVKLARSIKSQLKFVGLKTGRQNRNFGESFEAEAVWIESLSFKLENTSGKSIVYLQVNVNFPETRASGNLMSYSVSFGERPGFQLKNSSPLMLAPGETIEIGLEKEKDKIYKFVNERQPSESIREVELEIGFVVFDDKTAWAAGSFLRQDADNPRRYDPVGNEPPR